VSISKAQRLPIPYANWVGPVYRERGLRTAIRVARRAGLRIKAAARLPLPFENDPNARADRAYFDEVVRPLLDGPHVELVGELGSRERGEFLGRAAARVFPIAWPEQFGLAMPEALVCGTPVVALRCWQRAGGDRTWSGWLLLRT
jgi:glycosyltransferase involved in cell wall biosynthesis